MRAVLGTIAYVRGKNFLCPHAYMSYAWITHVHIGPTFLRVCAPPKNENKWKKEDLKCRRD
jgi:hypothetical protein